MVRTCPSDDLYELEMSTNLFFESYRKSIDQHLKNYIPGSGLRRNSITVPVVVHVLYNTDVQNVSDSQIYSQINSLNRDFSQVLSTKYKQAAGSKITFVLASADPQGFHTNGITRTYTDKKSFSTGAGIMIKEAGGKNAWPAQHYLNIWVGNVAGVLGFAYMPGSKNDGVVIGYRYMGILDKAPPFHLGRTLTHEVGHWLNLYHTWGLNIGCEVDDEVSDTPNSAEPNYGCRPDHTSCTEVDMVENYMDYSDDECMNLFTEGQITRMEALFAPGGYRSSIHNSPGLLEGIVHPCKNGIKDGKEQAVDCGGDCAPCDSAVLLSCGDGIQNNQEEGIDCGGDCGPCPTCTDGIKNGAETGIDCGGPCVPCPCISIGVYSLFDYIESIEINDTISHTGDNQGYKSDISKRFTLYTNTPNPIKLIPGQISQFSQEYWSIWVDWNQDNTFDTPKELIYRNSRLGIISDTIDLAAWFHQSIVPARDTYRLRIQMKWGEYGEGCEKIQFGEIEDYQVILQDGAVDLCTNGIKDIYEQGIDCGAGCIPCEIHYCTSSGKTSRYEFIQSVQLGDWHNVSGNNDGYIDFTPNAISITSGGKLNYKLQAGFGGNFILYEYWYVWADWNHDGDFEDAGELLLSESGTLSLSGSFTIPHGIIGSVRLRIQMKDSKAMDPCATFQFGEVEDYRLEITPSVLRMVKPSMQSAVIKLYPNPVSHKLNIVFDDLQKNKVDLCLINDLGQIVFSESIQPSLYSTYSMDCSNIPQGIYTIILHHGAGKQVQRISIIH